MTKQQERQKEIDAVIAFNKRYKALRAPVTSQNVDRVTRNKAIIDFHNGGEKSLQEVGDKFGMTRERVRQILKQNGIDARWHPPIVLRPPKMTPELRLARAKARFWSQINITANPDECWEWTKAFHSVGYPWMSGHRLLPWREQHGVRAQVVAWYLTHGYRPVGWVVNTCLNQRCLNPNHLVDLPVKEALVKYRKSHFGQPNPEYVG